MLDVTFAAVAKVIIAVLIGAYSSSSIPFVGTTMRDFGFLISSLLLPALTISNTARSVDVEVLVQCSILVIMNVSLIILGTMVAFVFQHIFFNSKRGITDGSNGVPREMAKHVRLLLRYDTSELLSDEDFQDGRGSSVHSRTSSEGVSPSRAGHTTHEHHRKKKKKKGIPYVAVKVSAAWRRAGVSGRDIVPHLTAPDPDTDYNPGYAWASYVAFSIANVVTLPLSLLESLGGSVSWVNYENASAYIFVYGIGSSIFTWTGGPFFVSRAKHETKKRRYIRLLLQEHLTRRHLCDAATQTGGVESSREGGGAETAYCRQFPYDWEREGLLRLYHEPLSFREPSPSTLAWGEEAPVGMESAEAWTPDFIEMEDAAAGESLTSVSVASSSIAVRHRAALSWSERLRELWAPIQEQCLFLLKNPPFMAIIIGMVIGLVPFLHDLFFDGGPLEMFMDGISLIGQGSISCSLLLLGANLACTSQMPSPGGDGEEEEYDHPMRAVGGRMRRGGATSMRHVGCDTTVDAVEEAPARTVGDPTRTGPALGERPERMPADGANATSLSALPSDSLPSFLPEGELPDILAPHQAELKGLLGSGTTREVMLSVREALAGNPSFVVTWNYDGEGRIHRQNDNLRLSQEQYITLLPEEVDPTHHKKKKKKGKKHKMHSDAPTQLTWMDSLRLTFGLTGISKVFVFGSLVGRLFIMPLISFILLASLIKWMPFLFGREKMNYTLVLTLFVEQATPTAINSAILFAQQRFMTYHWAKMVFLQYVCIVGSMVLWTYLGLQYTESFVNSQSTSAS